MTVSEFLFSFGVVFFQITFLAVVLFSYDGIRYKFLEDTQYKVNNTVVNYKGRQVKIEIKEKRLKANEFGFENVPGSAILYTYYINDKPAMCMYKLQRDGYANRYIAFNSNYDCSEIFKILKAGRKQFQKKFFGKM